MMTQRQCVFLKGDVDWCRNSARTLLASFDNDNIIYLSEHAEPDSLYQTITQKQAQKQLGKEFDAVVFDAQDEFNADSFGAIVGTIRSGGALLILLPESMPNTLWLKRFNDLADDFATHHNHVHNIKQDDELPDLTAPEQKRQSDEIIATADQVAATEVILNVVHGHRRRPLVLSSDRGRGKSAVLGMAAAELIKQGKQTIIVTAPSLATVEALFEHAARLLPEVKALKGHVLFNNAEIKFMAPDALIESDQKADLLLVDEAAAIPAPMLEQLLHKFSRIVFATTLHGYEGTGLGFAIRFKQILEQYTPSWRSLKMTIPIRWADNDELEIFSFKALLLDASPVDDALIEHCQPADCILEKVDRKQLINDETSLAELFGLMVLAHYRTRPSDLQLMLDRKDVSVYVMRYQGHIVASAWLVNEGGLDDELAQAIHGGTRRLKGQLLPQSLLAHVGITSAGSLNYQRIIRIAVHPAIQERGLGHELLNKIVSQVKQSGLDIVGTSFAVSVDLLNFWSKSQFIPVRVGLQQDDVSGSHSVMMLQAVSAAGQLVVSQAQQRIQYQWPYLVPYEFKYLEPELIIKLSALISASASPLSVEDSQDVLAFCQQQRPYESCRIALSLWLFDQIKQAHFEKLSTMQHQLSIMTLQQRKWPDIGKRLGLNGKVQIINALRDVVALLNSYDELG
jgi:tRNA(Met) cytidine acetyltransferase